MKDEKEPRLPGMPGPSVAAIQRQEAAHNALRDLHSAMLDTLDNLRGQEKAAITFEKAIRGDKIKVTITPGKEKP
jgi:hypothetical protein